jgi:hypothetical protein
MLSDATEKVVPWFPIKVAVCFTYQQLGGLFSPLFLLIVFLNFERILFPACPAGELQEIPIPIHAILLPPWKTKLLFCRRAAFIHSGMNYKRGLLLPSAPYSQANPGKACSKEEQRSGFRNWGRERFECCRLPGDRGQIKVPYGSWKSDEPIINRNS